MDNASICANEMPQLQLKYLFKFIVKGEQPLFYKNIGYAFILFYLLFLSGCSTTQTLMFKPAILHFDTPETTGEMLSGSVEMNFKQSTPRYIFGSYSKTRLLGAATTTVDASENVTKKDTIDLSIKLGTLDNFDVFVRSEGMFGLKVQLVGSPRATKEEGWKLALSAGAGDYSSTKRSNNLWFSTHPDAASSTNGRSYDASLNTGYRFNSFSLLYLNIFHSNSKVTGEIRNSNTILLQKNRTNKTNGALLGINLMDVDKHVFVTLETGIAKSSWTTLGQSTFKPVGVSLGYLW